MPNGDQQVSPDPDVDLVLDVIAHGFHATISPMGEMSTAYSLPDEERLRACEALARIASRLSGEPPAVDRVAPGAHPDTERLDWLEANPHACAVKHPWGFTVTDYDRKANNHRGATLREAIDTARSPLRSPEAQP